MKKYLSIMLMGMVLCSSSVWANSVEESVVEEKVGIEMNMDKKIGVREKYRKNFIEKLNLTEEQKVKAQELREKNKPQMQEIFSKMKELRKQAEEIRMQNKKEFEAILTPEQKEILEKMQKEHHEKIKLKKHKK